VQSGEILAREPATPALAGIGMMAGRIQKI
jgi:hypothetical protein